MSQSRTAASADLFFRGRPGDHRLGEWVKREGSGKIGVLGSPDDTGVTRNRGRAGAALGPDSIRKYLYKMTPPMDFEWEKKISLVDWGNVVRGRDIVETHQRSFQSAQEVGLSGQTIIALGGGHDFAAPHFLGFAAAMKGKCGLINVDQHLDVRELEEGLPHSGTPFRQILDSGVLKGKHFVQFGARACRNARAHYDYCVGQGVRIVTFEEIRHKKRSFEARLEALAAKVQWCGVTFDMDACSDAEGVSAAPVVGFSAWEMVEMARAAGKNRKVNYLEIAEVAPALDPTERSSRIAAEMIHAFLVARANS